MGHCARECEQLEITRAGRYSSNSEWASICDPDLESPFENRPLSWVAWLGGVDSQSQTEGLYFYGESAALPRFDGRQAMFA